MSKVDLYPLRRILQLVLLDGPVPGGTPWPAPR